MNKLHFSFFFLTFSSIYLGIHYYVYNRISSGLLVSSKSRNYLRLFFLIAALSFILSKFFDTLWLKPIAYFGALWLGIISIAFTVFLIADILKIFSHSASYKYYSVIFSLASIFLLSTFSIYNAARPPVIKEKNLKIEKIPEKLSGFSIVQLADLHLNRLKSEKWLSRIVDKTNNLEPDIIVITGDLIDSELGEVQRFSNILKNLKSKYGVYAVAGNHEFYARYDNFLDIAEKSDITILKNEKVTIAGSIELAGIDDKAGRRFSEPGSELKKALKNCDLKKPVILLSHQPGVFDEAVKFGVDLQLSGHTHAGQIPPFDLIVQFYFKYPYGLYRKNSSYIYTTSGTGTWGPPMRLFSRNEIVKFVLTK